MSNAKKLARNLLTQGPGRVDSHANAANTQIIAQRKAARHNGGTENIVKTNYGCSTNPLQILHLRGLHGLTEEKAQAMTALVWGTK